MSQIPSFLLKTPWHLNLAFVEVLIVSPSFTEAGIKLSKEERNLLSVAHKNMVGTKRSSRRVTSSIKQKTEVSKKKQQLAKEYMEKVEKEPRDIFNDGKNLPDKFLIAKANNAKSMVFN